MYSLLQLSKSYLSAVDDEVSLPSPTADGDTMLNELQVNIHFKQICSTASFIFSLIACKTTCAIISTCTCTCTGQEKVLTSKSYLF